MRKRKLVIFLCLAILLVGLFAPRLYRDQVVDGFKTKPAVLSSSYLGRAWATENGLEQELGTESLPDLAQAGYRGVTGSDELRLLARLVAAEAGGEPYAGKVAVAAVVLNRVEHPSFPKTVSSVIFQPGAFESVSNGLVWRVNPRGEPTNAAVDALNGWDPTFGALYFWNPYKPVSGWMWTRTILTQIGRHIFAR